MLGIADVEISSGYGSCPTYLLRPVLFRLFRSSLFETKEAHLFKRGTVQLASIFLLHMAPFRRKTSDSRSTAGTARNDRKRTQEQEALDMEAAALNAAADLSAEAADRAIRAVCRSRREQMSVP